MKTGQLLKPFESTMTALIADNSRVAMEVCEQIISEFDLQSVGREEFDLSRDINKKILACDMPWYWPEPFFLVEINEKKSSGVMVVVNGLVISMKSVGNWLVKVMFQTFSDDALEVLPKCWNLGVSWISILDDS